MKHGILGQAYGTLAIASKNGCLVRQTKLTKEFVEGYIERFGEVPTYTADTYYAIRYALKPTIEEAGSLDPDKIVDILEDREYQSPSGTVKYMKDNEGRHLHDLTWGPGYLTSLGVRWQDGELKAVWPNKWRMTPDSPKITYKGMVRIKIPPWMIEKYK